MQPAFKILADNENVTERIKQRLISLRISDSAGIDSDSLNLTLDDRDNAIHWPKIGAALDVSLGYEGVSLVPAGLFTVDEVQASGPPDQLVIRARAAEMLKNLHTQKTNSWDATTLGKIVETIAAKHKLEPAISARFAGVDIPHIDQTSESDLHFLTRLAFQYGAEAKPAHGRLLFIERGQGKAASGRPLDRIEVDRRRAQVPGAFMDYRVTNAERNKYQKVIANWHDLSSGKRLPVAAGDGDPVHSIKWVYANSAEAYSAAQARLEALQRGAATLSLSVIGEPRIRAETPLFLLNFREGVNGEWAARSVTHEISDGGAITRIEAETPTKKD